jgi:hypothetical protein
MSRYRTPLLLQIAIAGAIGFGGTLAVGGTGASLPDLRSSLSRIAQVAPDLARANCIIKGNVSIGSGERIYHVPGQRYYDVTVIDPTYGERWFCSEAEAREAGWRKSGV